ncbi:MAG: DUF58 domain-containing protein [Armatimonadetes bacterium]|nr:DUF58 domain-containing protein [Armatimonadota bacterium]
MEQKLSTEQTDEREELLDPEFLRKIERLSLVAKRVFPGRLRGERRSTKRGSAVEFADYRNYTTGDDLRRVDWNVYARLEKLFLKLFVEEEDLHVYILVDTSKSMDFGHPRKLLYAKRIAAALSYIALSNLDRVGLAALSGESAAVMTPKRGKQAAFTIFDYLRSVQASGKTQLGASIRDFSLRTANSGLAIVISDFLDPTYQQGLTALLSRKFEVTMVHLLDQEEVNPTTVGDLLMVDSETGEKREITITRTLLRRYQQRLAEFLGEIEGFAMRYGCNYVRVTNQSPFEDLILNYLRRRGALK